MLAIEGCESRAHISEQWTDLMDRGGLTHISDTTFSLFAAMEVELRSHLRADNPSLLKGVKDKIVDSIIQNEDVLFYWSVLSANWVEEEAAEFSSS